MEWTEGDVIRNLRERANWTLEELERASGVQKDIIHRIERRRTTDPKTATLERIAAAFGLTALQIRQAVPAAFPLIVRYRELTTRPEAAAAAVVTPLARARRRRA
jgi:transcriptional regulator with XRE-family HTH domain